jgi:hypothetical protein
MNIILKLWEENDKDYFYEIHHFVVIPVHQMLYGCAPPRISKSFIGKLKVVSDWFIEENFSYIKVFRMFYPLLMHFCKIPP